MSDAKAIEKTAIFTHKSIQEMYKTDNKMQEELMELFTTEPGLYEILKSTESKALGFTYNENGILVDMITKKVASEENNEKVQRNINKLMLTPANPLFLKQDLQYKDGLIYPIDFKDIKQEKLEEKTRGN
tara:strand:+ start:87 stop:476 length:390 start_codon:yes stop_codon:yes gene_type:complete